MKEDVVSKMWEYLENVAKEKGWQYCFNCDAWQKKIRDVGVELSYSVDKESRWAVTVNCVGIPKTGFLDMLECEKREDLTTEEAEDYIFEVLSVNWDEHFLHNKSGYTSPVECN